jgi:hypothetical protein
VVGYLPSKQNALSLNSSSAKERKKKELQRVFLAIRGSALKKNFSLPMFIFFYCYAG